MSRFIRSRRPKGPHHETLSIVCVCLCTRVSQGPPCSSFFFNKNFLMWTTLKVFIEFGVNIILLLFYTLVF